MTLPRILSLADDGSTLLIEPVPELEVLRFNPRKRQNIHVAADTEIKLDDISGDSLELAVEIEPQNAKEFGVKVRCSADGAERTLIICEPSANKLKIDISKSTLDEEIGKRYHCYRGRGARVKAQEAPFELKPGEPEVANLSRPFGSGGVRERPAVHNPANLSYPQRQPGRSAF